MKFKTDKTKGGYTILSLHGPDTEGFYAGVVTVDGRVCTGSWYSDGQEVYEEHTEASGAESQEVGDLVPAEPIIEHVTGRVVPYRDKFDVPGFKVDYSQVDDNLKLGFDRDTGKLLSAEVLDSEWAEMKREKVEYDARELARDYRDPKTEFLK